MFGGEISSAGRGRAPGNRRITAMLSPGKKPFSTLIFAITACLSAGGAAFGVDYDELRSAALKRCEAIDPAAYQSGLLFNPDGYRSYYLRSECFQRIGVEFRDETLCARVKRRYSLFWSSWGYSEAQCGKLVRGGIAADEKAVAEMKRRYLQEGVRLRDFRLERNGNGRDFDIVPLFTGEYAHGYVLTLEIVGATGGKDAIILHTSGYYVAGDSNLRIFLRREEIRKNFPTLAPGRPYTMRATVTLDIGSGGQAGRWSEAFIERMFPARERTHSLDRKVRF